MKKSKKFSQSIILTTALMIITSLLYSKPEIPRPIFWAINATVLGLWTTAMLIIWSCKKTTDQSTPGKDYPIK